LQITGGKKKSEERAVLFDVRVDLLCRVPGTAHVLEGEPTISNYGSQGKSQAQPDGGEGHSVITTGCPVTVPRKAVAPAEAE